MASDDEISNSMPSASTERLKDKRNPEIWCHTRDPYNDEPKKYRDKQYILYCKYCIEEPYGAKCVTNFRNHLTKKHEITVPKALGVVHQGAEEKLQDLYTQLHTKHEYTEVDSLVLKNALNKEAIIAALISLIIVRNLPLRLVEWPEFHAFCRVLNPEVEGFITTAHTQVRKRIEESWESTKDIVRKKLQSAISSIHLSVDIWTSPNRHLLLGVCAHFVEQNSKGLSRALLALRTVQSHSGED
jgi:hypothetical protein